MKVTHAFKARAHLLKLLGDELIGDDRLAVFELVKNAYDADATEVNVLLKLDDDKPKIIITDNGIGMSQKILLDKWLEIGTDSKRGKNRVRSPILGRMPLGEKGVGRLAVHKLGAMLALNTRAEGHPEYSIKIDWPDLIGSSKYLDEASIQVHELPEPKYFKSDNTGTRIAVADLYTTEWSRRHIRSLKKMVTSLVSPFVEVSGFNVRLRVPGREEETEDILGVKDLLDRAIWTYEFTIDKKGVFGWQYRFTPPTAFRSLRKGASEGQGPLEFLPLKGEGISRAKEDVDRQYIFFQTIYGSIFRATLKSTDRKGMALDLAFAMGISFADIKLQILQGWFRDTYKSTKSPPPRRLTPRECARLMGFEDSFKIPVSDSQAYRLLGTSSVVPVAKSIAKMMVSIVISCKKDAP